MIPDMKQVEQLAREMCRRLGKGVDPDALVLDETPYVGPKGAIVISLERLRPAWRLYWEEAYVACTIEDKAEKNVSRIR